jgi:hypothetical protein
MPKPGRGWSRGLRLVRTGGARVGPDPARGRASARSSTFGASAPAAVVPPVIEGPPLPAVIAAADPPPVAAPPVAVAGPPPVVAAPALTAAGPAPVVAPRPVEMRPGTP